MDLVKTIESRRSVRSFKQKKVKWAYVLEAIDAALKAPLAGNINALKFVIVTDEEKKKKIAEHADQLWVQNADTILVVCSEEAQLEHMYDERGRIYARQQAGAAIQNLLLRLTDLGVGACWIGAYLESAIKRDLKIPATANIEAIIPIGYADKKPKETKKAALSSVLNWEEWGVKKRPSYF